MSQSYSEIINQWFPNQQVDPMVCEIIMNIYAEKQSVSRRDIAIEMTKTLGPQLTEISPITLIIIMDRLLSWELSIWQTDEILQVYQFILQKGYMPSLDEFIDYLPLEEENTPHDQKSVDLKPYITTMTEDISKKTCCLCCEDFGETKQVYELPCKHIYHIKDCIEGTITKWFENHNTCPMCRTPLN